MALSICTTRLQTLILAPDLQNISHVSFFCGWGILPQAALQKMGITKPINIAFRQEMDVLQVRIHDFYLTDPVSCKSALELLCFPKEGWGMGYYHSPNFKKKK